MNNHCLIIQNIPHLFSILNEIKHILNFKIQYINSENYDTSKLNDDYLIISKNSNKKSNIFVHIEKYNLDIFRLIEIININFLKKKFNQRNAVKIGNYSIDLNSRKMNLNNNKLALTEKEIKILMFLKNSNKAVNIKQLQKEVWGYKSKLETHTVETHVYRLRKKIFKAFKDNKFIISTKEGYKFN